MSVTTATSNVALGGSGGGYPNYIPSRKRAIPETEEKKSLKDKARIIPRYVREDEVFLFTVKDPVKSILAKLMAVLEKAIERYNQEAAELEPNYQGILMKPGPLGYTDIMAFRPIFFYESKSIFKAVTK